MIADLTGRTVVVTGAGGGIGEGIARVLAEQGARVLIADIDLERATSVAADIGKQSTARRLDVGDDASVLELFGWIRRHWSRLSVLVNNAGIMTATLGDEAMTDSNEDWDQILNVNLRGTVRCSVAAAKIMKAQRNGTIINIASMAGHAERRIGGPYPVSKAAVLRYTKGLAIELAGDNVTVNAVCPGAVWTPLQERSIARRQAADSSLRGLNPMDAFLSTYAPVLPLGRPQTVIDVGKAVAFLASDDARNITGQCLHVDGGAILRD